MQRSLVYGRRTLFSNAATKADVSRQFTLPHKIQLAMIVPGRNNRKLLQYGNVSALRNEPMPFIDSEVHGYAANTPDNSWNNTPNWPGHVTGDEMVTTMDAVGVDDTTVVSAITMYGYDASYAVDEQLGDAALAALSIVGVSVLPVILLSLTIEKSQHGHVQGQGD